MYMYIHLTKLALTDCIYNHSMIGRCGIKVYPKINGRDKSRTHDLSHAKGTRYQLRHTPVLTTAKICAFVTVIYYSK